MYNFKAKFKLLALCLLTTIACVTLTSVKNNTFPKPRTNTAEEYSSRWFRDTLQIKPSGNKSSLHALIFKTTNAELSSNPLQKLSSILTAVSKPQPSQSSTNIKLQTNRNQTPLIQYTSIYSNFTSAEKVLPQYQDIPDTESNVRLVVPIVETPANNSGTGCILTVHRHTQVLNKVLHLTPTSYAFPFQISNTKFQSKLLTLPNVPKLKNIENKISKLQEIKQLIKPSYDKSTTAEHLNKNIPLLDKANVNGKRSSFINGDLKRMTQQLKTSAFVTPRKKKHTNDFKLNALTKLYNNNSRNISVHSHRQRFNNESTVIIISAKNPDKNQNSAQKSEKTAYIMPAVSERNISLVIRTPTIPIWNNNASQMSEQELQNLSFAMVHSNKSFAHTPNIMNYTLTETNTLPTIFSMKSSGPTKLSFRIQQDAHSNANFDNFKNNTPRKQTPTANKQHFVVPTELPTSWSELKRKIQKHETYSIGMDNTSTNKTSDPHSIIVNETQHVLMNEGMTGSRNLPTIPTLTNGFSSSLQQINSLKNGSMKSKDIRMSTFLNYIPTTTTASFNSGTYYPITKNKTTTPSAEIISNLGTIFGSSFLTNVGGTTSSTLWPVKHASVMEGDVILGGLMMVHSREDSITCGPIMPQGGIQALEAMLYTLDQVNKQKLLPNITLGAHILDDCDKDTYGLEMAVDFIKANVDRRKQNHIMKYSILNGLYFEFTDLLVIH